MARVSQIPIPWPAPDFTVTFRPSKLATLLLLAVGVMFVWGGIWLGIKDDKPLLYVCASFFALGIPGAVRNLLPGASYLTLKNEGFVICDSFRSEEIKWADVACFTPQSIGHIDMVLFDYVSGFEKPSSERCVAKPIAGYQGSLPGRYGFHADELAGILNNLRDQSLAG